MTHGNRNRVLAAALAVYPFVACQKQPPPARLAVAVPLSGTMAKDGNSFLHAVSMALEDAKPLLYRPVEIAAYDDRNDPAAAEEIALKIAADPLVFAVVGHLSSACSLKASPIYASAGLAMITPSSADPELTLRQLRPDWKGARSIFRILPSDDVDGAFAGGFAYDRLAFRSAWILDDSTSHGKAFAEAFKKEFLRRGGRIAGTSSVPHEEQGADFKAAVRLARRSNPDVFFFGGLFVDAASLLREMSRQRLRAAFISGGGARTDDVFKLAGPASNGAYFTSTGIPIEELPSASDFLERRKRLYNEPPRPLEHYAYIAGQVALTALEKGGPDRKKIVDALHFLRFDTMVGYLVFDYKGDTPKTLVTMTRANYWEKRFEPVY